MKIFIISLMFFSLCLYAKNSPDSVELQKSLKGSSPFACHIGKLKIIKVKPIGAFTKFSLEGSGMLINSGGNRGIVAANPSIEFMVPRSDTYIAEGKYISVGCHKTVSVGGGPFPLEFYVESKEK